MENSFDVAFPTGSFFFGFRFLLFPFFFFFFRVTAPFSRGLGSGFRIICFLSSVNVLDFFLVFGGSSFRISVGYVL